MLSRPKFTYVRSSFDAPLQNIAESWVDKVIKHTKFDQERGSQVLSILLITNTHRETGSFCIVGLLPHEVLIPSPQRIGSLKAARMEQPLRRKKQRKRESGGDLLEQPPSGSEIMTRV